MTITSASAIAASASSQASIPSGVTHAFSIPIDFVITDWPSRCVPSWSRACIVSGTAAAGRTWPRIARTRFARRTASSKSPPSIWVIAASRMLPTGCPPSGPPCSGRESVGEPAKRCSRTSPTSVSSSARAARQRRMSPTGGIAELVAEHARRPAVVGDRDDRGQVARVRLEAAQERRLAGPAADDDDARPAGERLPLVDQLDHPAALRRDERVGQRPERPVGAVADQGRAGQEDEQPAQRVRQELERHERR